MNPGEIAKFPPILQLVLLGLLAFYVLLSLLARVSPRLAWLWADPDEARGVVHWLEYTILPAMILAVASALFFGRMLGVPIEGRANVATWLERSFARPARVKASE